ARADPASGPAAPGHVRLLTGTGLDCDLCCRACDAAVDSNLDARRVPLVEVCAPCLGRVVAEGELLWWRGQPGVPERPEPVDTTIVETPLPQRVGPVQDLAPVPATDRPVWLLLGEDGRISRYDAASREWRVLATTSLPDEPGDPGRYHQPRRRLHASSGGQFAAVVTDYGRYGQVLDLRDGRVTLELDGGDDHPDTVRFSLAFADFGEHVVVHRTAWNRLDVSDAVTGAPLTEREPTQYVDGEAPPHYLDYFHGALHLSPTGRWIADDGWVWQPDGLVVTWDLNWWLAENPWESEDGPSRRRVCRREEWDRPMCWVGENLLAVRGIDAGPGGAPVLGGVQVFDVVSGAPVAAFAAPEGALFADGYRLYVAAADGLEIWDAGTGERTGRVPGFVPTAYHPGAGELAALRGGGLRRWRTARVPD
ncbi:MAG: hypothetical protein J2P15_23770, partial [Micromonosporaceae bacterium]|nr:hypothetical protein [Micromonosporaceae bacterium]